MCNITDSDTVQNAGIGLIPIMMPVLGAALKMAHVRLLFHTLYHNSMMLIHCVPQGLKTLAVEMIDLIKEGDNDKLSSTDLRKRQLGEYRHIKVTRHSIVH